MTPEPLQGYFVAIGSVIGGMIMLAGTIWFVRTAARQNVADAEKNGERIVAAQKLVNARLADTERLVAELHAFAEAQNMLRPRAGETLIGAFPCAWQYKADASVRGVLVVTNQRIRFDGPARDWTRTWDKVAKWDLVQDSTLPPDSAPTPRHRPRRSPWPTWTLAPAPT